MKEHIMSRYSNVDKDTTKLINSIINESFKHLLQARIKMIFDARKRKSSGKYVIGKIQKTNEFTRFLTSVETGDPAGFDYFLYLDEKVFEAIDTIDKIRVVRHLLQYEDIDYESDTPFKLRKEEVLTWYDEMEFNKEDPKWQDRLQAVAESIHNPEDNEVENAQQ